MIEAVALVGSRRILGGTVMPSALLSSPKNVSEGSEMPSSTIWMDTVCRESPVKIIVLEVVIKSKPAESLVRGL